MKGSCLKVYMTEEQKHDGKLLVEWLLERARQMGIPGASIFRATEGYGRHGVVHAETFFELAGKLPVELEIVATDDHIERLLGLIRAEGLKLFYVRFPVEFGTLDGAG
jgi:PII-like signaling protein